MRAYQHYVIATYKVCRSAAVYCISKSITYNRKVYLNSALPFSFIIVNDLNKSTLNIDMWQAEA